MSNNDWQASARAALESGDMARIKAERDALLRWHAAHHGGQNAPLDSWQEVRRGAIQGVYCTGCQMWPVIVALHAATKDVGEMTTVTRADIERTQLDTHDHIRKVQSHLDDAISILMVRANRHDASKLEEPELSGYAALQISLANVQYGTDAYRAALDEARPVIEHHYAANDHHPEHHAAGIAGMSLFSLLEMMCDWKAAGERTKAGSIRQSLDVNRRRFTAESQLFAVLENTARELGWLDEEAGR